MNFAENFYKDQTFLNNLSDALEIIFKLYIQNNIHFPHPNDLSLTLDFVEGRLELQIINKGVPIYNRPDWKHTKIDIENFEAFEKLSKLTDSIETTNLGRVGQCLKVVFASEKHNSAQAPYFVPIDDEGDEVEIRKLEKGEEPELSRLFYKVYGYNYINDKVYYPAKIKEMIDKGDLESTVAVTPKGRIVGHVGLVRHHKNPNVYEAALGLTDPSAKSQGLFSNIFKEVMEQVDQKEMSFCVYDFVTNLMYSQKLVHRYGSNEMCLSIGCQLSETQAKLEQLGLGEDPKDMDRYSILIGIKPGTEHPFGERVTLPVSLGELAEFILEPLNINWLPSPRFFPMAREGRYVRELQPTQKSVLYKLEEPGEKAVTAIINDWRVLLRSGYQYAAVDMPLDKPGIGQLHDQLASSGFFVAGFIPYEFSPRLGFRFQSIGPTKVAFEKIQVFSDTAKKLKEIVQDDYERNVLI